jgi:hypothetical protein
MAHGYFKKLKVCFFRNTPLFERLFLYITTKEITVRCIMYTSNIVPGNGGL